MVVKRYYKDVREALNIVYESDLRGKRGMVSNSADRIVCTIGYEGIGKSNLALIMIEEWYKKIGRILTPKELALRVSAKPEEFARILQHSQALDHIMIDEGVLMAYGRNALSDANKKLNTLLMVCRAKKYYINILMPNFLDLDSYIRKNRVTAIWYLLPDYKVAYFSKKKVRQLVGKLALISRTGEHPDVMKQKILPNFIAKIPLCDNKELVEEYDKIKQANMQMVIDNTIESLLKDDAKEFKNLYKEKHKDFAKRLKDTLEV